MSELLVTCSEGKWITGAIWQKGDRSLYYTIDHLREHYPAIPPYQWRNWLRVRCPALAPNVNGGRIPSEVVPGPANGKPCRVWPQGAADQVNDWYSNPKQRRTPPGMAGEWISKGMFRVTDKSSR